MAYKNNERVSLLKLFLQKFIVSKGQRCIGSFQLVAAFFCVAVSEFMNLASVTYCTIMSMLPVRTPVASQMASYLFTDSVTSVALVPYTPAWITETCPVVCGLVNGPATLICCIIFASSH